MTRFIGSGDILGTLGDYADLNEKAKEILVGNGANLLLCVFRKYISEIPDLRSACKAPIRARQIITQNWWRPYLRVRDDGGALPTVYR